MDGLRHIHGHHSRRAYVGISAMGNILHDGLDVFPAVGRVLSAHRVRAEAAAVSLRTASAALNVAMNRLRGAEHPAGGNRCLKLSGQASKFIVSIAKTLRS